METLFEAATCLAMLAIAALAAGFAVNVWLDAISALDRLRARRAEAAYWRKRDAARD